MKRPVVLILMLLAAVTAARAFSFSAVCGTGQRLYYSITSDNTVKVVAPSSDNDWIGYTAPTGQLDIPATVDNEGSSYAVTAIDRLAFRECTGLTGVHIPSSVLVVGMRAFANDSAITAITIDEGLQNIEMMAFWMCRSLNYIQMPSTLTRVAVQAFYGTGYSINEENWPSLIIGDWLIETANTAVGEVVIPEGVRGIANSALRFCRYMTGVTLPTTLRIVGEGAFELCQALDTVRTESLIPPSLADDSFIGISPAVLIPCGAMSAYSAAPYWAGMNLVENCPPDNPDDPDDPDDPFHPHRPYPVVLDINGVEAAPMTVAVAEGGITVCNAEGERLTVHDVTGRCVASLTASRRQYIPLPSTGLYLLRRQGGQCLKISYSKR